MSEFTPAEVKAMLALSLGISLGRWAPSCWRSLNAWVFISGLCGPELERLLTCTSRVLPCSHCADHMRGYMERVPVPAGLWESKSWLVEFHNSVSLKTKATPTSTVAEVERQCQEMDRSEIAESLWNFLLAVATLYTPETQREHVAGFLSFLRLYPDPSVRSEAAFDLTGPGTLFSSVVEARARSLPGNPMYFLEAVERFAPPQLYQPLGVRDQRELAALYTRFAKRAREFRDTRKKAYDRINGISKSSLEQYIEPAEVLFRGERRELSGWAILGIVLALILASGVTSGFLILAARKDRRGTGSGSP